MDKLRKLADGALRSIERNAQDDPKTDHSRQRAWWQGYRQCLDDVEDFIRKTVDEPQTHEKGTP